MCYKNGKIYELKEINRKNHSRDTCIYSILQSILQKQNKPEKQKEFEDSFLPPNDREGDTIPILLYSSSSAEPFSVYGNIGDCLPDSFGAFKTNFFRIEKLNGNSFTCSLLRPLNEDGQLADSILSTYRLEKTDFHIEIKLENFLNIQCASPKLVNRELLIVEQKF